MTWNMECKCQKSAVVANCCSLNANVLFVSIDLNKFKKPVASRKNITMVHTTQLLFSASTHSIFLHTINTPATITTNEQKSRSSNVIFSAVTWYDYDACDEYDASKLDSTRPGCTIILMILQMLNCNQIANQVARNLNSNQNQYNVIMVDQ